MRPESWLSWPVAAIKVKAWSVGIRIFVESGFEERLIVKTTVRFFDFYMSRAIKLLYNYIIINMFRSAQFGTIIPSF